MTDVRVTERFVDAAGQPVAGKISFEPYLSAVDATPPPGVVVTAQTVTAALDAEGRLDLTLTSSWDEGWQTADGTMPYRVTVAVDGLRQSYSALIPPTAGQTDVVLHELIDLGGAANVVVVPLPGPTAVSTDADNAAVLGSDGLIWVPEGEGGGGGLPDPLPAPIEVLNDSRLEHGLIVRRTDPALSTDDPEILVVYYGEGTADTDRATWTNEKGQLRTSNIPAPAEDALKIISATGATGNALVVVRQDGTIVARVGPNGTLIAEVGLRLVAGATAGRVLVSDSGGNATWQAVPVATGAAPPASPYVGQLWADPA